MLKTHPVVSHVRGLRPILQQIWKGFPQALKVSICSNNITHYEISIDCGIHSSATWSAATSKYGIMQHPCKLLQPTMVNLCSNESIRRNSTTLVAANINEAKKGSKKRRPTSTPARNICKSEPTSTTVENKCSLWDFKASRVLRRKAEQ